MAIAVTLAETAEDRSAVYRFRYDLYCRQQNILVDVADHDLGELRDEDDPRSTLLIARDGDRVVGTLRATWGSDGPFSATMCQELQVDRFLEAGADPAVVVVLSRFLIEADYRGGETSTLLIFTMAALCFERKMEIVVGDCEPHLLSYYRGLGFRPFGHLFSHATSLLVPVVGLIGDRAHLHAVESPVVHLIADDYCAPPAPEILAVLDGAAADDDLRIEEGLDRIAELVEQTSSAPRLLAGLDDDQIARLTDGSYLLAFRAGDLLIAEGTVTRTVFGILEGVVEVHRAGRLVAVLTAGDTVGEMAMVLGTERTATVRAATDGRALSISDRAMKRLMDEEPALAAGVLWNLCQVLAHKVSQHRPADG
jgi:hypothetical protein